MTAKERFIEIYQKNIKREGADKLLEYLLSSDFFTAPASLIITLFSQTSEAMQALIAIL